ncbi:hypothetical protein [Azospirillum doebereinerae]
MDAALLTKGQGAPGAWARYTWRISGKAFVKEFGRAAPTQRA